MEVTRKNLRGNSDLSVCVVFILPKQVTENQDGIPVQEQKGGLESPWGTVGWHTLEFCTVLLRALPARGHWNTTCCVCVCMQVHTWLCVFMYVLVSIRTQYSTLTRTQSIILFCGKNMQSKGMTLCSQHLDQSTRVALDHVFIFSQNSQLICLMPTSHRPKELTGGFGHELARVTSSLCKVLLQFLFLATLIKRIVHHYTSLADTNHMPRQILRGSKVIHSINPLLHKVTVNPGSHKWVEGWDLRVPLSSFWLCVLLGSQISISNAHYLLSNQNGKW